MKLYPHLQVNYGWRPVVLGKPVNMGMGFDLITGAPVGYNA